MRIIILLFLYSILATPLVHANKTGDVHLYCKPKVRVYIDEGFVGKTNKTDSGIFIQNVPIGQHKIRLQKKGKSTEVLTFMLIDTLMLLESNQYHIGKFSEEERNAKLIIKDYRSRAFNLTSIYNWDFQNQSLANSEVLELQKKYDSLEASQYVPAFDEKYDVDSLPIRIFTTLPILTTNNSTKTVSREFEEVWVKSLIDKKGNVDKAVIIAACGNADFDKLAINSVYDSKFIPALKNNQRVAVWVSWSIPFASANVDKLLSDIISKSFSNSNAKMQDKKKKRQSRNNEKMNSPDTMTADDDNQIGNISIYCQPGINVYLDDKFLGKSTENKNGFLIEDVPYGTHTIKIKGRKNNPEEWDINIDTRLIEIDSKEFPTKDIVIDIETPVKQPVEITNYTLEEINEMFPSSDDFVPVDKMPEMIHYANPAYPPYAYKNLIEGAVWVKALVDKVGDVREAIIGKSSGSEFLDKAALKVSILNKFVPGVYDGKPIAVWVSYKVEFKMDISDSLRNEMTNKINYMNDSLPAPDEFIPIEQLPEMIHEKTPEYPRLAVQAGIQGTVWVKALVGKSGNVIKAQIGKSSGTTSLDAAALEAAFYNKFKPAIQKGKPIAVWVTYKVDFALRN